MLEISIFGILAAFTLGGSIAMISNKQPVFSAFGFLVAMIGLAGMFALLNSQFLAIAQILVAVGAIVVLSMLTILTVNAQDDNLPKEPNKLKWLLFTSVLVTPFTLLTYKILSTLPNKFSDIETIDSKVIGNVLFSDWVFPFEVLSILLLTAMVAAIVISKKGSCDMPANSKRRRRL